jgi:hypothetical protein
MRYLLLLLLPLTLAACQERYRYPCQDPENWDDKLCKHPYCSANGTCPEDLQHYEKGKAVLPGQPYQPAVPAAPQKNTSKGDCK